MKNIFRSMSVSVYFILIIILLCFTFLLMNPLSIGAAKLINITDDHVPIYDNRSGQLEMIGELMKGERYPVQATLNNWYRLKMGVYSGYVHKRDTSSSIDHKLTLRNSEPQRIATTKEEAVIYDNSTGKLIPFANLKPGVEISIDRDYGNWWEITLFNRKGYIKKEFVEAHFSPNDQFFKVVTDEADVYDNRTGALVKVGQLVKGETYRRISDYGNWHQLDLGGFYGYVHKRETTLGQKSNESNFSSSSTAIRTFIAHEATVVYDNSSGVLEPFVTLEPGFKGYILADYGNWWRVNVSGRTGYIKKSLVTIDFSSNDTLFKTLQVQPYYRLSGGQMVAKGELMEGETFQRIRSTKLYHLISIGGNQVWLRRSWTKPVLNEQLTSSKQTAWGSLTPKDVITAYDNGSGTLSPVAKLFPDMSYKIEQDYGNWLAINVAGRRLYVLKRETNYNLIKPKDVVNPQTVYTFEQLEKDIQTLKAIYGDLVKVEIIGYSVEKRPIYAVKLGYGETSIFVNGAHHAREWLTANLLMEMLDVYSAAYVKGDSIEGLNVQSLLNNKSIWFVPMVNPDGVTLVQRGQSFTSNQNLGFIDNQFANFDRWKANIRGVDLNQQYPYLWYEAPVKATAPSYQDYRGPKPLSEPESRAVYDFTQREKFELALSYHSSGEVIYTRYPYANDIESFARAVYQLTGYRPVNLGYSTATARGYTDWFVSTFNKVALTIEIAPSVGPRPVPLLYWSSIWQKNKAVPLKMIEQLK